MVYKDVEVWNNKGMKKIVFVFLILLFSLSVSCTKENRNKNNEIVKDESNTYSGEDEISSDNTNEDDRIIEIEYDETLYGSSFDKVYSYKKYFGLSGEYSSLSDKYVIELDVYNREIKIYENKERKFSAYIQNIYENGNIIILSFHDYPVPWSGADSIEYNILINQLDNGKIKLNPEYPKGIPKFTEYPEYLDMVAAVFAILENEIFVKRKSYNFSPTHMVIGYDVANIGGGISIIYIYKNDSELVHSNVERELESASLVELIEYGRKNGEIQFVKIKYMYGENFYEGWCNLRHLREF